MSEPARNRFALDLEDLERQLRGAAQPQRPANAVDPLVELTRIVGQDDPLKDLFAQRGRGPAPARQEPSFAPAAPQPADLQPTALQPVALQPVALQTAAAAPRSAPPAELRGALDEFEALLRRTEGPRAEDATPPADRAPAMQAPVVQPSVAQAPQPMPEFDNLVAEVYGRPPASQAERPRDLDQDAGFGYAYDQQQPRSGQDYADAPAVEDEMPELEPQRSRKGLWTAAALLAVGVVGVGAAMTMRGGSTGADGKPPVIVAAAGPTKVAPVNPGGTEIPNQNKQIYERAGETPAKQAKVVDREEQPVDVQQAARTLAPRVVLAGPGTGAAAEPGNPLAQAPAAPERGLTQPEPTLTAVPPVPGLGEPRKVRTVSIRPDGTPAPAPAPNAAYANAAPSVAAAPARPQTASPATTATSSAPRPRPATPAEPPKTQERAATPAPATTPSAPLRIANVAPTPAAAPAPATAAVRAGNGEFTVQLAAPGSESEARATFAALQRKYPEQLEGQSAIVRKTELAGGKTVYRLRVGPYSRDDATTMCNQLQSSGGQCFIAKN